MPRYFFSLHGRNREEDDTGTELPNNSQARAQGIAFAADVLRDDPDLVRDGHEFRVEVTDEAGRVVTTVFVRAESH
ncbi:DUF6894 family protein [Sphingomonas bacterium]|uniref:DUF6894 family protein n=1 Tax=Sphingomonas bacterium TaxID=1895847 RepID=UPI001576CC59|nr:hypothetical protein [Sphingomonas bacterium]